MNQNSIIESARAWLSDPQNKRDKDYRFVLQAFQNAELANDRLCKVLTEAGNASSIATSGTPRGGASADATIAAEILSAMSTIEPFLLQK